MTKSWLVGCLMCDEALYTLAGGDWPWTRGIRDSGCPHTSVVQACSRREALEDIRLDQENRYISNLKNGDGKMVAWYTSMPGALACTVTHVALVPIDVVPRRKLTGCLNLFGKGGFSWFNKLFWEEIWRNRLNMMRINENLFQSGLQNWYHAP